MKKYMLYTLAAASAMLVAGCDEAGSGPLAEPAGAALQGSRQEGELVELNGELRVVNTYHGARGQYKDVGANPGDVARWRSHPSYDLVFEFPEGTVEGPLTRRLERGNSGMLRVRVLASRGSSFEYRLRAFAPGSADRAIIVSGAPLGANARVGAASSRAASMEENGEPPPTIKIPPQP